MRGGGESDDEDCAPGGRKPWCENNWQNTYGTNEHGKFSTGIDAMTSANERRWQPAPTDAADVGQEINYYDRRANLEKRQAVLSLQKIGNPKQIEPPDWVGNELAENECPGLTMR